MKTSDKKFNLGPVFLTPGATEAFSESGDYPTAFLARHVSGDWGDIGSEDWEENEFALDKILRLFSVYHLKNGTKIWIITEADRSSTTILLPSEY